MTVRGRFLPLSQLELACTALCCEAVPYAPNSMYWPLRFNIILRVWVSRVPRGARGGTLRGVIVCTLPWHCRLCVRG